MTRTRNNSIGSGLRKHAFGIAVGLLLSAVSTGAAAINVTAEQRAACMPDAYRLCSSEIPNVNRVVTCMRAKRSSLSPACRSAMEKAEKAMAKR